MASPFSFHCMICFEEFQGDIRYPVVLPCGHTYVCNHCAERLDKCMECRTSLVQIIPRGPVDQNDSLRWTSRTGPSRRPHDAPRTPPQPPIKKRLPLPKNVVLMSLIEATELAAENVRGQEQQPSVTDSPMANIAPSTSMLDLEETEEEKIKASTSLAISDCGTYAVAARDGLEIYPSRPVSAFQGPEQSEEDVDTLVRFFHLDHKMDFEDGDVTKNPEEPGKGAPPVKLSLGDRIQIVSTEAGWAKLARGYGFVRAGGHRLVKVGGCVDRACKLEAVLRLLSARRKQLRTEQMRVDNQFISLMNELQASLMADEDLTVITADTFQDKGKSDSQAEVRDNESSGHLMGQEVRSNNTEDSTPLKPRPMERPVTPPTDISRGFFCSSGSVFDSVITMSASSSSRQPPALSSAASPAIAEALYQAQANRSNSAESTPTRMFRSSAPHPSPSALKAGARAWREMHGRAASANLGTGIDFRTGMSGHSALMSASAHPHDYLDPRARGGNFRMSNHTGLTMWKSPFAHWRLPSGTRTNNLAMPSFGGGLTQQEDSSLVDSS